MRCAMLLLLGFGLSLITFGVLAIPGTPLAPFDLYNPAALFATTDGHLRDIRTAARELRRGLLDEFTAPYRAGLQRRFPTASLPE